MPIPERLRGILALLDYEGAEMPATVPAAS